MKKILPGLNIQWPISGLIIDGSKTIETRTYPIPKHYVGVEMALIETPGKSGDFHARIVATIKFGESFRYKNKKHFYSDAKFHHVNPDSEWAWTDKPKWGWPVIEIKKIKNPLPLNKKKGIKFTKNIEIHF